MNKSDTIGKLAEALCKAQASMGSAKKDAANPFFKSKYADLASVVDAVKKPLADNGLSYVQTTDIDETGAVVVETVLMHSSGEWLSGRLRMPVAKQNDAQALGSALTYCRRYGLQSMAGIPADDDDGNAATGKGNGNAGTTNANNGSQKIISGTHTPSGGALAALKPDRREYCERIASGIVDYFEAGKLDEGFKSYSEVKENDEKTAVWEVLMPHSAIRRKIKEMGEAARKAAMAIETAGQA